MSADRHDDAAVWATDWRDGKRRGESQTHYTKVLSMHLCKFCRHPTHSDGFTDRSYVGSDESRQVYQCIYTCYGRTEELCEKGLLPCKYHQPHVVGRQKEVWSHGYLHTASPAGDQRKKREHRTKRSVWIGINWGSLWQIHPSTKCLRIWTSQAVLTRTGAHVCQMNKTWKESQRELSFGCTVD